MSGGQHQIGRNQRARAKATTAQLQLAHRLPPATGVGCLKAFQPGIPRRVQGHNILRRGAKGHRKGNRQG